MKMDQLHHGVLGRNQTQWPWNNVFNLLSQALFYFKVLGSGYLPNIPWHLLIYFYNKWISSKFQKLLHSRQIIQEGEVCCILNRHKSLVEMFLFLQFWVKPWRAMKKCAVKRCIRRWNPFLENETDIINGSLTLHSHPVVTVKWVNVEPSSKRRPHTRLSTVTGTVHGQGHVLGLLSLCLALHNEFHSKRLLLNILFFLLFDKICFQIDPRVNISSFWSTP